MNNVRVELGPKYFPHGSQRHYNATGSSQARIFPGHPLQLGLEGVCAGKIAKLSDPPGNLTGTVAIGEKVQTGGQWSQLIAAHFSDGVYPSTGEPVSLAYARLRVADYLPSELNVDDRRQRVKPLTVVEEPGTITFDGNSDGLVHAAKGDIGSLILKCTTRQRLFITDTGYMGLCHRSCVEGDFAYLLIGGDMPFILRRLGSGCFQFKGEAYIHGIMDGELLLNLCKSKLGRRDQIGTSDKEYLESLYHLPLPFQTEKVTLA